MRQAQLSVIIPALNEEGSIREIVQRVSEVLNRRSVRHEIIVVNDNSTDKTPEIVKSLIKKYAVRLLEKNGEKGKAQALLEGFAEARYPIVAMIDADLQYPPEKLPEMLSLIQAGSDVVVANRKKQYTSWARKMSSKVFRGVFGEWLHGMKCDVQSGLKMFRKEVIQRIKISPTPWTFDLEFLIKAREAGYQIQSLDIDFSDRKTGEAKVRLLRTAWEIGWSAIKLKLRPREVVPFHNDLIRRKGKGFSYKGVDFVHHTDLPHHETAFHQLASSQQYWLILVVGVLGLLFYLNWHVMVVIGVGLLSALYFGDLLFNCYLMWSSLSKDAEIKVSDEEVAGQVDAAWPSYTILCPLYKEWQVVPQFVEAISQLEYPKDKLQVLLLLEEDDIATISKIKEFDLPDYFETVVVPHSAPKTKPKACNYGLLKANGEFTVIYDAEDKPDPQQLKKAVLAFEKVPEKTICIQAKLNFYNPHQNLITRIFTAEYSLWFDLILPGLQLLDAPIPLGGTSNHFRTADLRLLKGWDPFNVTEDCDLGIRLVKHGYRTRIVDSTTWEEANSRALNWYRQRTRWIKGYIQTYMVHTRGRRANSHNWTRAKNVMFQLTVGGKILSTVVNPLMWLTTVAYFSFRPVLGPIIESFYLTPVLYIAGFSAIAGNFIYLYAYMVGCAKREQYDLIKYVFLVPIYWLSMSIAAWRAAYEVVVKPHYWAKTVHGFHLSAAKLAEAAVPEAVLAPQPTGQYLATGPLVESSVSRWSQLARLPIGNWEKLSGWQGKLNSRLISGGWLVVATGLSNLFGFFYNAYLGRHLDPVEFGNVALIGSLIAIAGLPMSALSGTVVYRTAYLIGKFGGTAQEFWSFIRTRSILIAGLASVVWVVLSPLLAQAFHTDHSLPFILSTPIWVMSIAAAVDRGFLVANLSFMSLAVITFSEAFLKYVFAVLLVRLGYPELIYAAIPLSMVLPLIAGWWAARKLVPEVNMTTQNFQYFPKRFFVTSTLLGISGVAFLSMDIILAKHFLDPVSAGYYTLISLVGKMIYFFGQLFAQFTYPLVSRAEGAKQNTMSKFLPIFMISTVISVIAFVGFGILGRFTVPLLLGSKSLPILPYLPTYALAMTLYTITTLIVGYHQVLRHYAFSVAGFALAVAQITMLIIFHQDLVMFINTVYILSVIYFVGISALHIFYEPAMVVYKNFLDFLGLFIKLNGRRPVAEGNLRILFLNWRDTKHVWAGGAEVYAQEISKRWVAQGHKVTMFCGNDGRSKRNETIDGVYVVRRGGFYTVYLWAALYYIFKFRDKYDVVIDSENGVPFFSPLYVRVPAILLVHHINQDLFREHLRFPLSAIASFVEAVLMPMIYRNQKIITVSESSRLGVLALGFSRPENVSVVSPGVDLSFYRTSTKSPYPVVSYLGRHKPYKNIDVAIKAFKKVLASYPSARFWIAGEGENTWALKNLAGQLRIKRAVKFFGKVSEKHKLRLLGRSWVAVQPSSFEGWGITVTEANACGTPVVASNVVGLRDSVVDAKTGLLVPVKNVDAFANAIKQVISSPKYRNMLSAGAHLHTKNFTWEITANNFFEIVNKEVVRDVTPDLAGQLAVYPNYNYEE